MTGRKDNSFQSINVQLDEKNYLYWSYAMNNFLRVKSMWAYVMSTRIKPTNKKATDYAKSLDAWKTDNSKIIT